MNAIAITTGQEIERQANTDEQLVQLWLHGRSEHTQRAYAADVAKFRAAVAKPLTQTTLADLQSFVDGLTGVADSTKGRVIASVKSLFAFAHKLGYLAFDVARVVKLPKVKSALAERIISEAQTLRLISAGEGSEGSEKRNHLICSVLYAAGLRVSELCGLKWRDAAERGSEGQLTIFGKGGKTRAVLIPAALWQELLSIRGDAADDSPIFVSREGGNLDPSQVRRIVKSAAKSARINKTVSPHYLRHAHASHAIERGAPIHLVQTTLGHASVATTGRYLHARPTDSSSKYLAIG